MKSKKLLCFDKRCPIEKITILAALLDPRYLRLYDVEEYLENKALSKTEFYIRTFAGICQHANSKCERW